MGTGKHHEDVLDEAAIRQMVRALQRLPIADFAAIYKLVKCIVYDDPDRVGAVLNEIETALNDPTETARVREIIRDALERRRDG